jgi:hypothetical protein
MVVVLLESDAVVWYLHAHSLEIATISANISHRGRLQQTTSWDLMYGP